MTALYADSLRTISPRPTMGNIATLIEGTMSAGFCTTTGSANAYIAAPTPALDAYVAGAKLWVVTNFTNTGATTINVSGLGAKAVVDIRAAALVGYEMLSGELYALMYDGTNWRLLNGHPSRKTWTPTYSASNSMTYTSVTTTRAEYIEDGDWIDGYIEASGTTGGTASAALIVSLPIAVASAGKRIALCNVAATGATMGFFLPQNSTSSLYIYKSDWSNFGLGGGVGFGGRFVYKRG